MKKIAIYGAGGLGREVACLIKQINNIVPVWEFIGFFVDSKYAKKGESNEYGEILGDIDILNQWHEDLSLVIAIGTPSAVKNIRERIDNSNISFPNLIAPTVVIMDKDNVELGEGNIIGNGCWISCNVKIGSLNILNNYITVGHDSNIGDFNAFMPMVNISGNVNIGNGNYMGLKSAIIEKQIIEDYVTVGAGSIVMRKAKSNNLYMGNPAIKVKF